MTEDCDARGRVEPAPEGVPPFEMDDDALRRLKALAESCREPGMRGAMATWAYHGQGAVVVPALWLTELVKLAAEHPGLVHDNGRLLDCLNVEVNAPSLALRHGLNNAAMVLRAAADKLAEAAGKVGLKAEAADRPRAPLTGRVHHLKVYPAFFAALRDRTKRFECRMNDRDYQVGDLLALMEYDPAASRMGDETLTFRISYILHGTEGFGIEAGYCVMSLEEVDG
jgi:hypothetical protein